MSTGVGRKQNLFLERHMRCDPTFSSSASPVVKQRVYYLNIWDYVF